LFDISIMIYTIVGALGGAFAAFCIGKMMGMKDTSSRGPSELDIFMFFGLIFGGGGGFFLGSSALIHGDHPYNKILNMAK